MRELFLKIVNMSISASWLVLAVLVLRFVLKKAPKWVNVLLWGIVAVRLICPFSLESAMSLIPSAETIPTQILEQKSEAELYDTAMITIADNPLLPEVVEVSAGTSEQMFRINLALSSIVWAFGIFCFVGYTTISYWRLRRRVSEAVILRKNIYQSERVDSPFVLGIIRPKIYLPYHMDGQDLVHVIAHEQAHIRRRDHWWKPLGFLLLTVHWFNPLMWLAYVLLCRDIELACDEKVIKELGSEQRADYSQALVSCSINRRMVAACPLAFGEVGVKERVKSVMTYKKPAFWFIVASVIACTVIAVCFLTNPICSKVVPEKLSENTCVQIDIQAISVADFSETKLLTVTDGSKIKRLVDLLGETTFKKTMRRFYEAPDNLAAVIQLIGEESSPNENNTIFSLILLTPRHGQSEDYSIYVTVTDSKGEDHYLVAHKPEKLSRLIVSLIKNEDVPAYSQEIEKLLGNNTCKTVSIQPVGLIILQSTSDSGLVNITDQEQINGLLDLLKTTEFKKTSKQFRVVPDTLAADITLENNAGAFIRILMLSSPYRDEYSIYVEDSDGYYLEAVDPEALSNYIVWLVKNGLDDRPKAERIYIYEEEGFGGKFSITLNSDGSFSYYEGLLSSYIGMGTWKREGDILTLTDYERNNKAVFVNHFKYDGDDLLFIEKGSSNFVYVTVKNGERFHLKDETANPVANIDGGLSPDQIHAVKDNTVTEIGRGTLNPSVELTDEDAVSLLSLIASGSWENGIPDCAGDCAINLGGRLIYYHSECGTLIEYDLSEISLQSHTKDHSGQHRKLSEADRIALNNILSNYIDLLYGITDIAPAGLDLATLKDLVQRYGEDLTWDHFSSYHGEDVGSGLYIMRYEITDADCYLLVGGASMDYLPPAFIRLVSASDENCYIYVLEDDIDVFVDFVNSYDGPQLSPSAFVFDGVVYDLAEGSPSVNAVMGHEVVGDYIIAEGHVGPYNAVYGIINTKTQKAEKYIAGTNLIWHSNDINTIVYSFWSDVCAYDGTVLASLDLASNGFANTEFISNLSFSDAFTHVIVEIMSDDGTIRTETVDIPV